MSIKKEKENKQYVKINTYIGIYSVIICLKSKSVNSKVCVIECIENPAVFSFADF